MGDSSLPETRPIAALSLAELEARFATPVSLSPDDVARLAARIPILRRRYNEHLQRAKIQFVDPRLTLTSCRSLLLLGRATVGVSHLVYHALRSLDEASRTPTRSTVAPEVVEAALDWSDRQIELIAWQLRALDAADTQSAALRALFAQLELHPRLTPAGWIRLTGDVISAATGWLDSALALPRPGLTVQAYLAEIGQVREAEAAGRGMEAARIVARLVTRRGVRGFDPEMLTLAALSHDCGLMLVPASARVPATTATTKKTAQAAAAAQQLRDLHASTGAALVAGLSEFSTELPALVAQHHRRLNDPLLSPAFPPRAQSPASRLLAVVVRWLELLERAGQEPAEPSTTLDQDPFAEPARRLWREAERGDWDRGLVEELLTGLGVQIADPAAWRNERRCRGSADWSHGGQLRLDPADDEWPRSNLDSASFDSARFRPTRSRTTRSRDTPCPLRKVARRPRPAPATGAGHADRSIA